MKKIMLIILAVCFTLSAAEIRNLQADYSSGLVKIQWQTVNELNLKHFVIEKSQDGKNFVFLTIESPKGIGENYVILDRTLFGGKGYLYYRVKMVDNSNGSTISEVVKTNVVHSGISATWGSIKAMFR